MKKGDPGQCFLSSVEYRPLGDHDKDAIQRTVVTGNLTIGVLAGRPGMSQHKMDVYRKAVLAGGPVFPGCNEQEMGNVLALNPREKEVIRAVEGVKYRLLEGFVARLVQLAKMKLNVAKWFSERDVRTLRADLKSEALAAFMHAVWHYNRYEIAFNTFLTTVVDNWLQDYCEKLPTIKMGDSLKDLVVLYYSIRTRERKEGRRSSFDEITAIIVANELRDAGTAQTQRNVETALERNRPRFLELQQVIRRVYDIDGTLAELEDTSSGPDVESLLNELAGRLTPLQQNLVRNRVEGGSLRACAKRQDVPEAEARAAFNKAKEIIGRALAFAG